MQPIEVDVNTANLPPPQEISRAEPDVVVTEPILSVVLDPPKKETMKEITANTRFQKFQKSTGILLLYILKAFAFTDANKVCMWLSTSALIALSGLQVYLYKTLLEKLAVTVLILLILIMTLFKLRAFRINNYMRNKMAFAYMFLFEFAYFYAYYSYSNTKKTKPKYINGFDLRIISYVLLALAFVVNGCTYFLLATIYAISLLLLPFFGLKRFYIVRVFTEIFDARYPRKSKQITIKIKGTLIENPKTDTSCPLCLDAIGKTKEEKIVQANCHPSHVFHLECMKYMLIYSKACPYCRKVLTDDNIDFTA